MWLSSFSSPDPSPEYERSLRNIRSVGESLGHWNLLDSSKRLRRIAVACADHGVAGRDDHHVSPRVTVAYLLRDNISLLRLLPWAKNAPTRDHKVGVCPICGKGRV